MRDGLVKKTCSCSLIRDLSANSRRPYRLGLCFMPNSLLYIRCYTPQ